MSCHVSHWADFPSRQCRRDIVPLAHDLLQVRTDAEKFLLLAALNLLECVSYVGAQLQST
ncbi:hypothetical protein D3C87_1988530 [compost metagenome]|uniref:Uncharacterized protein n=1 Tax=Variovorax paradoxus TaxID=34073 RepID=A0A5Q0M7W7_VARPD|nr:hypothetical protein GFK26_18985 [Variovorax paradoxus]